MAGRMALTVLMRRPRMLVAGRSSSGIFRIPRRETLKWIHPQFSLMSTESFQKKSTKSNQNGKQSKGPEQSRASIEWIRTFIFGIIFGVLPTSLMINNIFCGLGTTKGPSTCPTWLKSSIHPAHFAPDVLTRDLNAAHFESSWILTCRSGLAALFHMQSPILYIQPRSTFSFVYLLLRCLFGTGVFESFSQKV